MDDNGFPTTRLALGGREFVLRFNVRAWRLIAEHADFDVLSMSQAQDEPLGKLLASSKKLPRIIWALMQNQANGAQQEWPDFDWVEENLDFASLTPAVLAIASAMPQQKNGAQAPIDPDKVIDISSDRGNVQPEASLPPGAVSGQ